MSPRVREERIEYDKTEHGQVCTCELCRSVVWPLAVLLGSLSTSAQGDGTSWLNLAMALSNSDIKWNYSVGNVSLSILGETTRCSLLRIDSLAYRQIFSSPGATAILVHLKIFPCTKLYNMEFLWDIIKSTNTSALAHTTTDEHKSWSEKFTPSTKVKLLQQGGQSNLDVRMWLMKFASRYPGCMSVSLDLSVRQSCPERTFFIQTFWISLNIAAGGRFLCFGSAYCKVGLRMKPWVWRYTVLPNPVCRV